MLEVPIEKSVPYFFTAISAKEVIDVSKLNKRQQAFAEAYTIPSSDTHGNATKSAIKAGYSKKGAHSTGSKLLRNDKVSKYIEGLREELFDTQMMSGKEVLYRLSRTARGDSDEEEVLTVKTAEFVNNPNNKKNKTLVYNEHVEVVKKPVAVKDQNKALELLGKFHKLWTEKQEVEVTTPIFLENVPDDDE